MADVARANEPRAQHHQERGRDKQGRAERATRHQFGDLAGRATRKNELILFCSQFKFCVTQDLPLTEEHDAGESLWESFCQVFTSKVLILRLANCYFCW
jgi:hypothetical protein